MTPIRAEMVAKVVEVVAAVGQDVLPGDTVLVLESMKMEIPVLAETAGRIDQLTVSEGTTVAEGEVLVVLE